MIHSHVLKHCGVWNSEIVGGIDRDLRVFQQGEVGRGGSIDVESWVDQNLGLISHEKSLMVVEEGAFEGRRLGSGSELGQFSEIAIDADNFSGLLAQTLRNDDLPFIIGRLVSVIELESHAISLNNFEALVDNSEQMSIQGVSLNEVQSSLLDNSS